MKRKLIIHVGMGKTGSSSIQKTLRESRNALELEGVKYLGLMLEHLQLPDRYSWHQVSGWRNFITLDNVEANQELASALLYADVNLPDSIKTLVWSNESLFDRLQDVNIALDAIKERFDIQVVGYIRRPDSWITSAYLQWGIKHKTYPGPLKPFRAWASNRPYVVSVKVEDWRAVTDQCNFFNFDEITDVSGHFVETVLGLTLDKVPSRRDNDTPAPAALAMFAYHNSLSEGQVLPDEIEPLLKRAGLVQKLQKSPPYNRLLPTESDVLGYVEKQSDEIARINEIFRLQGEPEFHLSELRFKDYSSTPLDTNRALLQLIFHLYKEIEGLKDKLSEKGEMH